MKPHPLSEVFPLLEGEEFETMVRDIEEHGLREPVVTYEGMIIDGRNRWRACKRAGLKQVPTVPYEGDDPVSFVISANLHRRHLSVSQRAMIGAGIAKLMKGNPSLNGKKAAENHNAQKCAFEKPADKPGISQSQAADALNVSRRMVQKAKKVAEKGTPEQVERVKSGKATIREIEDEISEQEKAEAAKEQSPAERMAELAADFCREINQHTRAIDNLLQTFEVYRTTAFAHDIHWPTVAAQLVAVRKALHQGRPKRTCPYCKGTGKDRGECKPCKGCGHVCEAKYKAGCAAVGIHEEEGADE